MIMFNNKNLDELQLIIRGNIFKHGLFALISLLLLNSLLYHFGIDWATGKWAELTIVLFTIIFCSVEFICHDIYPLTQKKQKYGIYFLGIFGIVSILICLYEMFTQEIRFMMDGKISNDGLGIVFGIMFASVPITYFIKSYLDKSKVVED